jgi:hypothetical protein
MTHSLNNEKSRESVRRKLRYALKKAEVVNSGLRTWNDDFEDFRKDTLKSVGQWATDQDVAYIAAQAYKKCCIQFDRGDGAFKLVDLVDEKHIEEMVFWTLEELTSLPAAYHFDFATPQLHVPAEIKLNDDVTLRSPFSKPWPEHRLPQLTDGVARIRGLGYASYSRQQSAMRDAISKLKVTFQLGHIYEVFARKKADRNINLIGENVTQKDGVQYVRAMRNETSLGIPISLNLSQYLNEVSIPNTYAAEEVEKRLHQVKEVMGMMYHQRAEKNAQSIRRALEWSFDAIIDGDETTQFIKTCIGLEAALTDQVEGMGITEQLADRCAFLLNKTTEAREDTRRKMRKIYQLRSKIVHGAVLGLSLDDFKIAEEAKSMLTAILRVEITGVINWWQDKPSKRFD